MERAVITGLGFVSALGIGRAAFLRGLHQAQSPVRELTLFDTSALSAHHAAWIDDWDPLPWIKAHRVKRMDRCTQFAVVAARLALDDAKLALRGPHERAGVSIGTALGGFGHGESWHERFTQGEPLPPGLALQIYPGSAQGNVAIELGLQGPGTTNSNSCAAGQVAIGDALRMIQRGELDVVLAGGCEAPISPMIYTAFDKVSTMDPSGVYRPYDAQRAGFIMGEGAAMLVIESRTHALARGAHIIAEVVSYAAANEAHHMTTPDPRGRALQRCINRAMSEAGLTAEHLSYINPHASGTQANDVNELEHLQAVLGDVVKRIPCSGTKPYTGHTLGAAGAMELATIALCFDEQHLPPTLNLTQVDAAAQSYTLIRDQMQRAELRHALSLSRGFGGIETALVMSAGSTTRECPEVGVGGLPAC
jgi:3-oxoacyl-[acyl-carrier-protein] synthase II